MILSGDKQMTFFSYDLDKIVRADHVLRQVKKLINFVEVVRHFEKYSNEIGRRGYGLEIGIKVLFLQYFYDLSDREVETRLKDDTGFKWFCGFKIDEQTPDHTFCHRVRELLGTKGTGDLFKLINKQAKAIGIMRHVFTFVDSSVIKAKETTWEERDKAIKEGEEALNNENIKNYSSDKDARFGCKGKDDFWYGYKRHNSVDMGSGLIDKTAATPANTSDGKAFKKVCPEQGMVFADKGYCSKSVDKEIKKKNCHSGVILKNNMKNKNKDKDRWISKVRAPFERVFSVLSDRTRYKGLVKTQMQIFWESIAFNIRRLIAIHSPPLFVGA